MSGLFKTFLSSIAILFLSQLAYSQVSNKRVEVANQFVKQADLVLEGTAAKSVAKELYIQAARIDPENIKANFKSGELYLETINKDRAASYFKNVQKLDPNYTFNLDYLIGRSYHFGLEFDEAITYYKKYQEKLMANSNYAGKDKVEADVVEKNISECYNGKKYVAEPKEYSIKNLGLGINSIYDDYAPVINRDNTLMIFTTRRKEGNLSENVDRDNEPFEEIYLSTFDGENWKEARNIGAPINTEFHNSNLALSADGNTLFLYTDNGNGDIMYSEKKGSSWSEPVSIGPMINSLGYKESSVCLSPDGGTLYFSSNRPGGYGGSDIYFSTKDTKGQWKRAKNLGSEINTKFDDDGPFVDFTGKFMYFSSKGHEGMGGYDIYKSEFDSAAMTWKKPENMGYPINTADDDIYFVATNDSKTAYYATIRPGGFGLTDIYIIKEGKFEAPEVSDSSETEEQVAVKDTTTKVELKNIILTLKVKDNAGNPLSAKVSLVRVDSQIPSAQKKVDDGVYKFKVEDADNANYRLSVEKDGFAFFNEDIILSASTEEVLEQTQEIILSSLVVGTSKVLRNIYFDFNRASIKEASFDELSKVEDMLARNPNLEIEISGHTDNIGQAVFNKNLSQRRVDAVKKHLVRKGIDSRRITAIGYGEEKPLASNDDEREGRELNRRVEFKVLKE